MTGTSGLAALAQDLDQAHGALDAALAGVEEAEWATPTPAEGWDVKDSVFHLAYFDEIALRVRAEPEVLRTGLFARPGNAVAVGVGEGRLLDAQVVVARWRAASRRLTDEFAGLDESLRLPWFGRDMSVRSFVTARSMEVFAHGQDIADALDVAIDQTPLLPHVAHLGVLTRPFSYANREREMPTTPVRVELDTPDGSVLTWGPEDAVDSVRGPVLDFCLVVTQRRHHRSTDLVVSGAAANEWLEIAQAFAGPPGAGRPPGPQR